MSNTPTIMEYECPCCGAGLRFDGSAQKLSCEYCDTVFELDTIKEYNETIHRPEDQGFHWEDNTSQEWSTEEQGQMNSFICQSCGGELISDGVTVATFCPYCDGPVIITDRVSGGLRPDAVIPFKTTKEDAQKAFLALCKGKPLLPKDFTSKHRLEKITGMYVPFWLYDCSGNIDNQYRATRVHTWSDSKYRYTKTDYFMLSRAAKVGFHAIPMDASTKMEDQIMESIEPFDMDQAVDYDNVYLSGYFADKYDVESKSGEQRIRQRVDGSFQELLSSSFSGYASVTPTRQNLRVDHSQAKYVLLPVWMLNTKYKDKSYVFAMNGQTGKMTGTLPIDQAKKWGIFSAIAGGITVVLTLLQMLAL